MRKTTLNLANLEALGSQRLAKLVLDLAAGNTDAKRRLRMELMSEESLSKLSNSIRKRLTSIAESDRYIGWRSLKAFIADLETHRNFIIARIAPADVQEALELAWMLLGLANSVLERTTDTSDEMLGVFRKTSVDIAQLASNAVSLSEHFHEKLFEAAKSNLYGQSDGLITNLSKPLGNTGLVALRNHLRADPPARRSKGMPGRHVSRWKRGRIFERDTVCGRSPNDIARQAEEEIADALGDVDTYISIQPDPKAPATAIRIATRLTKAGRPAEALSWLDPIPQSQRDTVADWGGARIEALLALGRDQEAQAFRWSQFEAQLDVFALLDYLRQLPDFDDIEAEERAFAYAAIYPDATLALNFFIEWPALDQASALILARLMDIRTSEIHLVQKAAERLAVRYPLAATLILRRAAAAILQEKRHELYEMAGQMLAEGSRLSARIEDWAGHEDQNRFIASLQRRFKSVSAFWQAAA